MAQLVAKNLIKGLASGIVYAEKFDEVEIIEVRVDISFCRNLRTGELFHCRNEKIGTVAEANGTVEEAVSTKGKVNKIKNSRSSSDNKNQMEIFV